MKTHILFAGARYEQSGGAYDIYWQGTYQKCIDMIPDAVEHHSRRGEKVWYHILDLETNKIMVDSEGD